MIKTFVKTHFPHLFKAFHSIKGSYYLFLGKHNPEKLIRICYYNAYHRKIDLKNPRDIDEKVNYLKLYTDTTLWSICTDKYEVRQYVKSKGLEHTLNKLYGCYEKAEEIDFDALPKRFVLKTTNGGGGNSVLICNDRNLLNIKETIQLLNKWLKMPVGYKYAEYHYLPIKPRLIAEKYLSPENHNLSLVDYKINCFNGRPHSVFLCSDREFGKSVHYSVYDLDWKLYPEKMKPHYRTDKVYPRPKSLDKILEYSAILSKGIPYVRVDWYEIEGQPIFSEMTFTPGGGFQSFYTDSYLLELGEQVDLTIAPGKKG